MFSRPSTLALICLREMTSIIVEHIAYRRGTAEFFRDMADVCALGSDCQILAEPVVGCLGKFVGVGHKRVGLLTVYAARFGACRFGITGFDCTGVTIYRSGNALVSARAIVEGGSFPKICRRSHGSARQLGQLWERRRQRSSNRFWRPRFAGMMSWMSGRSGVLPTASIWTLSPCGVACSNNVKPLVNECSGGNRTIFVYVKRVKKK